MAGQHANRPTRSDTRLSKTGNGTRRFARVLIVCLLVPVLLCVPVILMLRYDTGLHASANAILKQRIKVIDAQIPELRDWNSIRTRLLERKPIVETVQSDVAQSMDALSVFGHLPGGVQLLAMTMQQDQVTFDMRTAARSDELAMLAMLAQRDYNNLRVVARQKLGGDAFEQITIAAGSPRAHTQ